VDPMILNVPSGVKVAGELLNVCTSHFSHVY
jgi:hypothetical protein